MNFATHGASYSPELCTVKILIFGRMSVQNIRGEHTQKMFVNFEGEVNNLKLQDFSYEYVGFSSTNMF